MKLDSHNTFEKRDSATIKTLDQRNVPTVIKFNGKEFKSDQTQLTHDISHSIGNSFVKYGLERYPQLTQEMISKCKLDPDSPCDFNESGERIPSLIDNSLQSATKVKLESHPKIPNGQYIRIPNEGIPTVDNLEDNIKSVINEIVSTIQVSEHGTQFQEELWLRLQIQSIQVDVEDYVDQILLGKNISSISDLAEVLFSDEPLKQKFLTALNQILIIEKNSSSGDLTNVEAKNHELNQNYSSLNNVLQELGVTNHKVEQIQGCGEFLRNLLISWFNNLRSIDDIIQCFRTSGEKIFMTNTYFFRNYEDDFGQEVLSYIRSGLTKIDPQLQIFDEMHKRYYAKSLRQLLVEFETISNWYSHILQHEPHYTDVDFSYYPEGNQEVNFVENEFSKIEASRLIFRDPKYLNYKILTAKMDSEFSTAHIQAEFSRLADPIFARINFFQNEIDQLKTNSELNETQIEKYQAKIEILRSGFWAAIKTQKYQKLLDNSEKSYGFSDLE